MYFVGELLLSNNSSRAPQYFLPNQLQFNRAPAAGAPFTGMSAFAHKGGIHVSAVNKIPDSYQHIDPAQVGNHKRSASETLVIYDWSCIETAAVLGM